MNRFFGKIFILWITITNLGRAQEERIELIGTLTQDTWKSSGGLKSQSGIQGNLDLVGNLYLWKNGDFSIRGFFNYGNLLSESMGDFQVANNMEAPEGFYLYELWYQHHWEKGKVILGQQEINNTFAYTTYGSFFVNSSFGIGPEMTVNFPLSTYPLTGLGLALRQQISPSLELGFGLFDGHPGLDSQTPWSERLALSAQEGHFWISEIQLNHFGTHKLGFWDYKAEGGSSSYSGYYLMGDIPFHKPGTEDKGWGIFYQLGRTLKQVPFIRAYQGIGCVYRGLFTDNTDGIGMAYGRAQLSRSWQQQTQQTNERVIELSYDYSPKPWIRIQPTWQMVFSPTQSSGISDASVFFVRLQLGGL